jgi:hypothetical protein
MGTKTKPKKRVAILEPRSSKRPLRKIDDLPPSLREPARQALIGFVAYAQARRGLVEMELLPSHDEKG